MKNGDLQFETLADRHPGISGPVGASHAEAARVCLHHHAHVPPKPVAVVDDGEATVCVARWREADARARAAWANTIDATEAGAYALALAAVEARRGLAAVRRAHTKTGADYYLGLPGDRSEDLDAPILYRLEISGTDSGAARDITARLRQKRQQARDGESDLPAIVSVVAFAQLKIVSEDVKE